MERYVDFIGRFKRMQLANFTESDKKQVVNDALALLERHLFGSSGEVYFLTGLEGGSTCLNLGQELTAIQDVFRISSDGLFIPMALFHDVSDFISLSDGIVAEEIPWACLVANNLQIQESVLARTFLRNWEQFTADQFGGTSQNFLLFNGISPESLEFRIVGKRGFKRIVSENDTNLAITDYPDLLMLAVRQVIALERGNFKEVREVRGIFEDALFAAHRLLAQKDNDWLGENNG